MSDGPLALVQSGSGLVAWDPFQLMDRLDEDAIRKELEGIASTDLVYVVKDGGQEVVGLSKTGVDECCIILVAQGQVIREEELHYEVMGEGEDREALFKVRAARYAVHPDGREVKLDQVLGVKRQPLYGDPAEPLSLDTKCPGKKAEGRTFRQMLEQNRNYLEWMARDWKDASMKTFVAAILNGEDVTVAGGRRLNPHWFEHGAMKAARNARFRLIPANVRAQTIARARQAGQARTVDREANGNGHSDTPTGEDQTERLRREEALRRTHGATEANAPASPATPTADLATDVNAPSEKQVAFFLRLIKSDAFSEEERDLALDWLESQATRQTIKDQIDWAKRKVETRAQEKANL